MFSSASEEGKREWNNKKQTKKKQRKKNPKPCQHFLCVIIGGNRQMNALSFSGDLQLRMCDERDIILYLAIQYAC